MPEFSEKTMLLMLLRAVTTIFLGFVTPSLGSVIFFLGFVTYRGTAVNMPRHGGKLTAARRQTYRGAAVSDESA